MRLNNNNHDINWSPEKINRLWTYYSKNLSPDRFFSFHSGKYILDYTNRYMKLNKVKSILDFGCGPGFLMERLIKKYNCKVYGFDFSKEAIDKVNKKFLDNPKFGEAICVDELPLPLEENSVDIVFSIEVIEHLDDESLNGMLGEVYRILKPGGHIVLTTPNEENLDINKTICPECGCIFHRWQHIRNWDIHKLKILISSYKFRIKVLKSTFFRSSQNKIINIFLNIIKIIFFRKIYSPSPHLILIGVKDA